MKGPIQMWLFVAFLALPLIEIALFIQIGGMIGLWLTLLIVILTAVLGTFLVRTQGLIAIGKLQSSFSQLQDPTEPLAHGAMILFAGALLLTPGFFTDGLGFALCVPMIRSRVFHALRQKVKVQSFSMGSGNRGPGDPKPQQPYDPNVIDGDFEEVENDISNPSGQSGWTKH
jgi:UPF0716 protein FxsA